MQDSNYLLQALEASVKECRRLEDRVRYLEGRLGLRPEVESKTQESEFKQPKRRRRSNRTYRPWQKKDEDPLPEIELKSAHKRSTNDLYREARERHEKQVSEQEKYVDEAIADAKKSEKSVDVRISEQKKRLLVETASEIMNKPGN